MSKIQSALGDFLGRALLQAQARPKGLANELCGWTEIDFDLPSLHDLGEMYRKTVHLTKGRPNDYLLSIAKSDAEFRGHRDFELEGNPHCGFLFFRNEASFFLVFSVAPKRSTKLYVMGKAAASDSAFKKTCSDLVLAFDGRLQQLYYSFQKNLNSEPTIP